MAIIKWPFVHFASIFLAISFYASFAKVVESDANYNNSSSCDWSKKLLVKCHLDGSGNAQVCYMRKSRMLLPNVENNYKPSKRFQLGQMDCDGRLNMKDVGLLNYQNLLSNFNEFADQISKGAFVEDLTKGTRFMPEECYQDCGDSPECFANRPTMPPMPPICKMPWKKKFPEMKVNGKIVIKGKIYPNAEKIIITLLHNRPDWDEKVGNSVAMKMEAYFTKVRLLTISSFDEANGGWIGNEIKKENPFKEGQQFQMEIDVLKESLIIQLNGQIIADYAHRVDVWKMNWLRIEGDICLNGEPIVQIPQVDGTNFTTGLSGLLRVGDIIKMDGSVPCDAKQFSIEFLYKLDKDLIYPMILRFYFYQEEWENRREPVVTARYYRKSEDYYDKELVKPNPVHKCESFKLEILVTEEAYNVSYCIGNNDNSIKPLLEFKYEHGFIYFPYWTADHIRITGDVYIKTGPTIKPTTIDDPKILQVYGNSSDVGLEPGDVIEINGTMTSYAQIGLFYGSLGKNLNYRCPLYIQLIPRQNSKADFTTGIIISTYYAIGDHGFERNENHWTELFVPKQLYIRIEMAKEFYNITMFSNHKVIFRKEHHDPILPIWSVEYIVVKGKFLIDGKIKRTKSGKNMSPR